MPMSWCPTPVSLKPCVAKALGWWECVKGLEVGGESGFPGLPRGPPDREARGSESGKDGGGDGRQRVRGSSGDTAGLDDGGRGHEPRDAGPSGGWKSRRRAPLPSPTQRT